MFFRATCFFHFMVNPENRFVSVQRALPQSLHSGVCSRVFPGLFNQSLVLWHLLNFLYFAITNHAALNPASSCLSIWSRYIFRVNLQGGVPGWKEQCSFLRCWRFCPVGLCFVHSHQRCLKWPISPQPCQQSACQAFDFLPIWWVRNGISVQL